jgi:ketosteroid isomerase-like protein
LRGLELAAKSHAEQGENAMSVEGNKQIIRNWFSAVNSGDEPAILDMLSQDFEFRGMGRSPEWVKYVWGRADFAAAPRSMSESMVSPIQMEIVGMIAEGDEVAVEAKTDSMLKNGKKYDNAYHFVFVIRDGLVSQVREYCCTHLVNHVFGPDA